MKLVVVGSVALDSVKTPFGQVSEALGGSATYFSTAASYHAQTGVVAVVGEDFPEDHLDFLRSRPVDTTGLNRVSGKTFRWQGEYGAHLDEARTLETHLNVFEHFHPRIPDSYRSARIVFLANIHPDLQLEVLEQTQAPEFVAMDTMNLWIDSQRDTVIQVMKKVHLVTINEGEARQLIQEHNLVKVAREILKMGPRVLIIKQGGYGALLFTKETIFSAPAYPLETVMDPTGAGDSFAGGFMGHLARTGDLSPANFRKAAIVGSVMASFCVEAFSLDRFRTLNGDEISRRYAEFKQLTDFGGLQAK